MIKTKKTGTDAPLFPCLMKGQVSGNIYLMTNKSDGIYTGTRIHKGQPHFICDIGEYSDCWRGEFAVYTGKLELENE